MPLTRHTRKTSTIQYTPKTKQFRTKNLKMTPTFTAVVSTVDKRKKVTAAAILGKQQKAIPNLKTKVELLEEKSSELKCQIHITSSVNTSLETKTDDQEQYSRSSWLVITGLQKSGRRINCQKMQSPLKTKEIFPRIHLQKTSSKCTEWYKPMKLANKGELSN